MPERYGDREREADRSRRYRGEGYYGGFYDDRGDREREREYGRRGDERGFLERLREELRSWFNEEDDAGRRRMHDERDTGRWGGSEDVDRDWARQWGYLEGRGQRGADRSSARGWGYSGGYGAGAGYQRSDPYGSPSRSWGRYTPWQGYGETAREGPYDYESQRYGGSPRSGGFRGSFAGRGPRGYQRSDDRIREDICERMCDSAELDASGIEILVVGGEVTLQGTVSDRYDKRLAEDLTERVSGVREVNNHLRVAPGMSGEEGQQQQQQQQQNRPGEPPRYRVA